jgi:hypothetical protein
MQRPYECTVGQSVGDEFGFDATELLCSSGCSLFRMKFWTTSKNLNQFWVAMRIYI